MATDFEKRLEELSDEDSPITEQLLVRLSGPSREEVASFRAALETMSPRRRADVATRMVECAEERFEVDFIDIFRGCLRDPDPQVRCKAIEGLWEDQRADLVIPLVNMLRNDPEPSVRAAAAMALGRFVYSFECDELDQVRGTKVCSALEQVVANEQEDVEVVRRAIESLGYINSDDVRRIIDSAYVHTDPRMRESAVFAMGRSADPFWASTILTELLDTSPAMRYEAARASGELQLTEAVAPLIRMIGDEDEAILLVVIWALGQIGGKRARLALQGCLKQDDPAIIEAATAAIDELDFSSQSLDLLVHELDDDLALVPETEDGLTEDDLDEGEDYPVDEEWPDEFVELP